MPERRHKNNGWEWEGFYFFMAQAFRKRNFFSTVEKYPACKPGTRARTLIRSRRHSIRVWNRSYTRKRSSLFEQQMFVAIEQRGKAFKSLEIEHNSLCTTTMAFDYHLALIQTPLNACTFSARKIKKTINEQCHLRRNFIHSQEPEAERAFSRWVTHISVSAFGVPFPSSRSARVDLGSEKVPPCFRPWQVSSSLTLWRF